MTTLDLVTSGYILHQDRVLLVAHSTLGSWLPPGGHIEEGETPDECVLREIAEETGFDALIVSGGVAYGGEKSPIRITPLHRPIAVQLEEISPQHLHVNFVYACRLRRKARTHGKGSETAHWFAIDDLVSAGVGANVVHNTRLAAACFREHS